jgi:predicted porin
MMKKSILAIAVATLAASSAAMAESTVYGNIHVSINQFDKDDGTGAGTDGNLDMTSNTSSVGVKGSEDLGDGMKAIYQAEFEVNAADGGMSSSLTSATTTCDTAGTNCTTSTSSSSNGNALTQRDIFVGLKGGFGTIKFGTMSSNYKQTGAKVDALYRTPAEGRGFIATQSSALHGGRAINRGRQTNTVQYVSPKFSGIELVANTTVSGNDDETNGVGVRWSNKNILVYVDWIDGLVSTSAATPTTEAATKVGAKFDADKFFIGGQYEMAEDRTGYDYMHLNGGFNINANNAIILTYGTATHISNSLLDTTGMALAYNHNLSKMTNVYVAYMDKSSDTSAIEDSAFAFGIKKKF